MITQSETFGRRPANPLICLTALQINARSADDGLTVDLSQMRGVVVDPVQQTAVVQGPAP